MIASVSMYTSIAKEVTLFFTALKVILTMLPSRIGPIEVIVKYVVES